MKQLCHCVCQRAKLRKHNVFFILWCQGVTRQLRQSIKKNHAKRNWSQIWKEVTHPTTRIRNWIFQGFSDFPWKVKFGISGFHFFFIWPYLCNVKSYLTSAAEALAALFVQISESNLICLSQNKTEKASIRDLSCFTNKVRICSINMIELFDFPKHCRLWQNSLLVAIDCSDTLKWRNTPNQPLLIQMTQIVSQKSAFKLTG